MRVSHALTSLRQLTVADKQLAADLSSGIKEYFASALGKMIDRGMIRQGTEEPQPGLVEGA